MRLVTFGIQTPAGELERLGVLLDDDRVADLNAVYRDWLVKEDRADRYADIANCLVPPNLLRLLEGGRMSREALQVACGHVEHLQEQAPHAVGPSGEQLVYDLSTIRLRPPLQPLTLREFSLCEGHIGRGGTRKLPQEWYDIPTYFKGLTHSVIGPGDAIPWPSFTERLDYELEIAAVIGKKGTRIPASRAHEYIAGFTIFNDVSARDMQAREKAMGHGPAKSKDFCNILGPCLLTSDETDGMNMSVFVRVNGKLVTESRNNDMQFSWANLVEYISRDEILYPGDVFSSGVVTGCAGVERLNWSTEGAILQPGDVVELGVTGIGVLRNRVAERAGV